MKTPFLCLWGLLFLLSACSTGKSVVQVAPAYPIFPGGEDSLQSFLKARIHFPDTLRRDREIEANCVIDSRGKVTRVVVRNYNVEECQQQVEKALNQMPDWTMTEKGVPSTGARCSFLFKFQLPDSVPQQPYTEEDYYESFCDHYYEPEFPGGKNALKKFIQKKLGSPLPVRLSKKGDAVVRFITNKDASLMPDSTIIKGAGKQRNRKITKALQAMPKWRPGSPRSTASRRCTWEMVLSFGWRKYPKVTCQLIDVSYDYFSAKNRIFERLPQGPFQRYFITIERE